jgi:hypothetical protein
MFHYLFGACIVATPRQRSIAPNLTDLLYSASSHTKHSPEPKVQERTGTVLGYDLG